MPKASLYAVMGITSIIVAACATPIPTKPDAALAETIQQRAHLALPVTSENDAVVDARKRLLADGLTLDEAVAIALSSSPDIRVLYAEFNVAETDVAAAGLLSGSVVSLGYTHGNGDGYSIGLMQNVTELLLRSGRDSIASHEYARVKLELAERLLAIIADVKSSYYRANADEQLVELMQQVSTASRAAAELAQSQYDAGTLSRRDQLIEQVQYEQLAIETAGFERQTHDSREHLNRLLGVSSADDWKFVARLPELPSARPEYSNLEQIAVAQRLDYAAGEAGRDASAAILERTRSLRYLDSLGIGMNFEKGTDGEFSRGPRVEFGLPLFNQGAAKVAQQQARLNLKERQLDLLVVNIQSETHEALEELLTTYDSANRYRKTILPLQQQIVDETLKHNNGMLVGVYDLLMAKRNEISTAQSYLNALRDFWLASVKLERVVGGRLPDSANAPGSVEEKPPAESTKPTSHNHHAAHEGVKK